MTSAPSLTSASMPSRTAASTPGSAPSPPNSRTTPIRTPDRSPVPPCRAAVTTGGTGAGIEVESHGSWPAITACSRAASSTVRAHGPGVSRLDENATRP